MMTSSGHMNVKIQVGCGDSVCTSTTELELTPSPVPRRRSSLLRGHPSLVKAQSQLLMPSLDSKDSSGDDTHPKRRFWTTFIMKAIYGVLFCAFVFNRRDILYAIPLILLLETIKLLLKWTKYLAEDPYVVRARKSYAGHRKLIKSELKKTQDGGFLRRKQEMVMGSVSYMSRGYWMDYLDKKSSVISNRAKEEIQSKLASFGGN